MSYGTTFQGWVRDSSRPLELPQSINPGNAADEVLSEALTVRTSLSQRLLIDMLVEPKVVTPNGDGVNEKVDFSFKLLQITSRVSLSLKIFDLSGEKRRVIRKNNQYSGFLHFSWDGRDNSGNLVPPGLYVYQVSVEAENGEDLLTGTIGVAY